MKTTILFLYSLVLFLSAATIFGQAVTKVNGVVYDADTKQTIPFADVYLLGTNVGVSTDADGYYTIETRFASDTVVARYLGYKDAMFRIKKGQKQTINFTLQSESVRMETVEVKFKKEKYSKKNNPALELAKKVTSNKKRNQLKGLDYYSYDKYEKVRFDLNNITEGFKQTPLLKDFDFLWDYIDTSELNGRTFLPLFIREVMSTHYYRKSPESEKERRHALKFTKLTQNFDVTSMNDVLDILYHDIDIYEDQVTLLDQQFVSPLASVGPNYYRYYIIDTTVVNGRSAINLAFIPSVKGSFGFTGNMYISNDDRYTVLKVDMGIIAGINLNFVRDMKIVQEFSPLDTNYIKTKDEIIIDYSLSDNGLGAYGNKTVYFSNYKFTAPEKDTVFSGIETIVDDDNIIKSEEYWNQNRSEALNKTDAGLYKMVDSLVNNKRYKTYVYLGTLLTSGYAPIGPVEFGPLATFVSFNDVEGVQYRFGGGTTFDFSKKIRLQAYGSYVTKTDLWKYSTGITYSFNKDYKENPRHYIRLSAEKASYFPGQDLAFFDPDNLLLSFRRGKTTNMILNDHYQLNYVKEGNGYTLEGGLIYRKRLPYGTLTYNFTDGDGNTRFLSDITTTEAFIGLKYAPNERIIQRKDKRVQIFTKFPIIRLNYYRGFDGLAGGQYDYHRISLNLIKQFQWTVIGSTDLIFETGKTFGEMPYLLQFIPRGNQTYAYQLPSYNMMNFLEFAVDQYASVNFDHRFYGLLFNRVPLLKKLKLREVISFKMLYGSLSDKNNPNLHPEMVQFHVDDLGNKSTYTFDKRPYIEASVGITNIFKLLRIDVIKRFNYLENPNLPYLFGKKGMGIRAAIKVEF